jgi:type I restriction enzyme S subunit
MRVPLNSLERDTRQGDYRYYGAQGVIDHIDNYIFDGQFVLVAEDGANLVTRNEPIAFLVEGQFWVNNHAHVVKGKEGVADDFYITALLNSLNIAGFITGVAQPKLSQQNLKQIKVSIPSYEAQRRIADILSAYDDLIENNRRRMALLEEEARHLYREWFIRRHFPGHEHIPITNGVPEGWERKTLGDLCTDVRETASPDQLEPDMPYIGLEHMPRRSISLSEWGRSEEVTSTKHRFRAGEILFGRIRPYFHKVGIAFVDGVASSDAIVIRPWAEELGCMVLMAVSSDPFVASTAQSMRAGSKMPRADWKLMKQYPIPLPPHGLLNEFNGAVRSIIQQLKILTFQNQKLRTARDLLLPRLMSGEIAV